MLPGMRHRRDFSSCFASHELVDAIAVKVSHRRLGDEWIAARPLRLNFSLPTDNANKTVVCRSNQLIPCGSQNLQIVRTIDG